MPSSVSLSSSEVPVVLGSDLVGLSSFIFRSVVFTVSVFVRSGRWVSLKYAVTEMRKDSSRWPRPDSTIHSSIAQKLSS
eukprot:scaffold87749_cov21-Phaeocystis_antarctica.AAC.1